MIDRAFQIILAADQVADVGRQRTIARLGAVMGRHLGPSVLDSIRAARSLPAAGLDPEGPLGIYGYSEGGCAAGWALQLQPTYAPELNLGQLSKLVRDVCPPRFLAPAGQRPRVLVGFRLVG